MRNEASLEAVEERHITSLRSSLIPALVHGFAVCLHILRQLRLAYILETRFPEE
jgi:hypothetical protein